MHPPPPIPQLTFAEYFAGIGLVRMGLEQSGWRVLFANDNSEQKREMYLDFFPGSEDHLNSSDVFDIDPAIVPRTLLATCSFPCIDLSLAGNMTGITEGKHSSAFWGFTQILRGQGDNAPPMVMAENVPGWLHSNNGADFRLTVSALADLGYSCDVFTLDALRFTPQSRERVFLVGTRGLEVGTNAAADILKRPKSLLPDSLRRSIVANPDLPWVYHDIPEPPPKKKSGLSAIIIEPMAEDDERWWSDYQVNRHLAMMAPIHHQRVMTLAAAPQVQYRTFFRRRRNGNQQAEVRSDDLSGCLRTAKGGSAKQFIVETGNNQIRMRAMTPREYARLQGVPDTYPINVNEVQALTGFGDAVCVPAISWIAQHVLNPLAERVAAQLRP